MIHLKDVIHYYIGQRVVHPGLKNHRILTGRWLHSLMQKNIEFKPILRRLEDITDEEIQEAAIRRGEGDDYESSLPEAHEFHYLLKQGFDLWGLIDSGQAVDAKTLNQKV